LNPVGEGTERVELEARRLFPQARIARLDGDTLRRPSQARRLWAQVYGREVDLVVGTQAVFQRGPLPAMGLVGIVQADVGLHVPDFRAAERTYQLLVEAVAAARSAADGGKVVLQTSLPAHHAVEAVVLGEPRRFYGEELAARRLLGYPPAVHLAGLSVSGKSSDSVDKAARHWRIKLGETAGAEETLTILGPVPAPGGRPRGHHRRHMLVKGPDRTALCSIVSRSVEELEREYPKRQAKFVVDIDPVEMS
jgi:primosomal protein N' (replication factor Y)